MAEVEEFVIENQQFIAKYPAFFSRSTAEKVYFGRHLKYQYSYASGSYREVPGPTHVFERFNHGPDMPSWARISNKSLCGVGTAGSWKFKTSDTMFEDEDSRMCPKCAARLRAIQKEADRDA